MALIAFEKSKIVKLLTKSVFTSLFSKFYRNKLIKKEYGANSKKDDKMVIMGDKCYLYEPFINKLWMRSNKYSI